MNRPATEIPSTFPETPAPSGIPAVPSLQDCIARHHSAISGLADVGRQLQNLTEGATSLDALIAL